MSIHVMRVKFAEEIPHESGIETIALANGTLLVNDCIVDCETSNGSHNWVRTHADGAREFGSLKISIVHGMCMASGVVLLNGRKATFSAASMLQYDMTIKRDSGSQPWYSLAMGFVADARGTMVPTTQLLIPGDDDGSEFLQQYSLVNLGTEKSCKTTDTPCPPSHLTARIDIDREYCYNQALSDPDTSVYNAADITFSLDYATLSGQAYEFLIDGLEVEGDPFVVEGKCTSADLLTAIQGIVQGMPPRLAGERQNGGHNASDADFLVAAGLQSDLRVEELFSLPMPAMETLHEYSFDKLKTLMLYAVDDDTLHLFGETRPQVGGVLKSFDVDLLRNADVKKFLTDDFAVGYLTEAFSKSDTRAIKDDFEKIPNRNEKLSYFWSGDGSTSFSKSKGYNMAMSNIMNNTFGQYVPGLEPYKKDNPEGWAKTLYDYCMSPKVFTGLALQTSVDQQGRVTQLSSILYALDPQPRIEATFKGEKDRHISYSTALHEQVVNRQLFEVTRQFQPNDEIELKTFLTEYFKLEFDSLLADGTWQGEVNGLAREELQELMKEFNVTDTRRLVTEMETLIADSAHIMVVNRKMPMCNQINAWAQNQKTFSAKCGKFMTMAVYGFAIFGTVTAFMNWGKLEQAQKRVVLKNVTAVTANIFSDVTVWVAAGKLSSIETKASELMQFGVRINQQVQLERATALCERIGVQLNVEMADVAGGVVMGGAEAANDMMRLEELGAAAAKWEKIAAVTGKFARAMTVAALGAACVAGGYQIAHDFKTGQPAAAIVFDILGTVATGIALLVEVGTGIAGLLGATVASIIPMIGVVAAIVGIVAAFVGLFLHKKPISPAQKFVREKSTPFIQRLAMPDRKWLDEQGVKDAHLGPSLSFALA